ncbi:hypothetical protein KAI11_02760, partial [Candidatus Bathyarchaeota archaeon]|nr:hypothetical protein [Candidatus Bathyarchaeota archaeon]
ISVENIGNFILSCRAFQINPSLKFFTTKKSKISKNNSEKRMLVALTASSWKTNSFKQKKRKRSK